MSSRRSQHLFVDGVVAARHRNVRTIFWAGDRGPSQPGARSGPCEAVGPSSPSHRCDTSGPSLPLPASGTSTISDPRPPLPCDPCQKAAHPPLRPPPPAAVHHPLSSDPSPLPHYLITSLVYCPFRSSLFWLPYIPTAVSYSQLPLPYIFLIILNQHGQPSVEYSLETTHTYIHPCFIQPHPRPSIST